MADNVTAPATGAKLATDEATYSGETAHVPVAALVTVAGAEGSKTATPVSAANPVPVAPAASENVIGAVAGLGDLIDVTLSLDTSAYASGDVLADTQAVANAVRVNGGSAILQSLLAVDEDDQGIAFDLVFLSGNSALGTENAAPSISDAGARDILGVVSIATADFIDLGGARVANIRNIGLFVEAATGSRSLYVAAIARGAGTYTGSGIKLRLGLVWA